MFHVVTPRGTFSTPRAEIADLIRAAFGTAPASDPDTATRARAHATRTAHAPA